LKIFDLYANKILFEQNVFLCNKITSIKIFDIQITGIKDKIIFLIGENKISYFYWKINFLDKYFYINENNSLNSKINIRDFILEIRLEYPSIKKNINEKENENAGFPNINKIYAKLNNKIFGLITSQEIKDKLKSKIEVKSLLNNDMILDCLFVPEKNLLILGTVNNYVLIYRVVFQDYNKMGIYDLKINYLTKYFCPEKCIVYAMSIKFLNLENESNRNNIDIYIGSGTVFRKIVYWKINFIFDDFNELLIDKTNITKIQVLKGHEGVVFNLDIINLNKIISVSDDRTCKIWQINYDNTNKKNFEIDFINNKINYKFVSLYDHNARVWNFKYDENLKILATVSEDNTIRIYNENSENMKYELLKTLEGHIGKNIRTVNIVENFIFSSAEDGQLIKWDIKNLISSKNDSSKFSILKNSNSHNKISQINKDINFTCSLSNEDEQFLLARKTQKNFSSCVKCLKIIDLNLFKNQLNIDKKINLKLLPNYENYIVLIGSNHGDLMYSLINKDKNIIEMKKIYSDENLRIINSILYIYETKTILAGLSDGVILLIKFDPFEDLNIQKYEVKKINVFSERKIRITHIYYQIFKNKYNSNKIDAIFIFSNPIAENKIFFFDDLYKNDFIEDFICKYEKNYENILNINTFVLEKLPTTSISIKRLKNNEFIIFFGDFNGIIYHTIIKKIENHLYNYNEMKYFIAHEKEKISKILIQKDRYKISDFINSSR